LIGKTVAVAGAGMPCVHPATADASWPFLCAVAGCSGSCCQDPVTLFLREATVETVEHAAEDDLERYAMRTLPAAESDQLEEHLLICAECRDRLTAADEYVTAMRSAAAKIRESGTGE
jgi:uncharacterized CHY-type Zn-finger protein